MGFLVKTTRMLEIRSNSVRTADNGDVLSYDTMLALCIRS